MIHSTHTKTFGLNTDNYSIISLVVAGEGLDWVDQANDYIIMNFLQYNNGVITSIQQRLSYKQLDELSTTIWEAKGSYDRRQRDKKKEVCGEESV